MENVLLSEKRYMPSISFVTVELSGKGTFFTLLSLLILDLSKPARAARSAAEAPVMVIRVLIFSLNMI